MNLLNFNCNYDKQSNTVTCVSYLNNMAVSKCRIYMNQNKDTWTISAWYTVEDFMHQGFGKETLKACLNYMNEKFGIPENVEYIWNGANKYVFDWLDNNFGAISKCPIAVMKYANDDDWESHIYTLNTRKFLEYFDLKDTNVLDNTIYDDLDR